MCQGLQPFWRRLDGKTKISLKEYGGETIQLAKKAAKKNYDLVIG